MACGMSHLISATGSACCNHPDGSLCNLIKDLEESLCTPLKAILQSLRCTISPRSVDERSVSSYRSLLVEHEIGNEIELGVAEDGEVVHERGDRVHVGA